MSNQIRKTLKKKKKTYTADEDKRYCRGTKVLQFHKYSRSTRNVTNLEVERAGGTMVALAGSTKPKKDMPSNSRKFYRELKKIKEKKY